MSGMPEDNIERCFFAGGDIMTDGATIETAILDRLRERMSGTYESKSALRARIAHEDAILSYRNGRRYIRAEHIALTGQGNNLRE